MAAMATAAQISYLKRLKFANWDLFAERGMTIAEASDCISALKANKKTRNIFETESYSHELALVANVINKYNY